MTGLSLFVIPSIADMLRVWSVTSILVLLPLIWNGKVSANVMVSCGPFGLTNINTQLLMVRYRTFG
jgi:hypothetical protein